MTYELWFWGSTAALAFAARALGARGRRREKNAIAEALGLALNPWWLPTTMQGDVDGVHVEGILDTEKRSGSLRLRVRGLATGLTVTKRGAAEGVSRNRADHRTGDLRFDAELEVGGDTRRTTIRLDADTRRALLELFARGGAQLASNGNLTLDVPLGDVAGSKDRLRLLVAAAQHLAVGGTETARLREIFRSDPSPLARQKAFAFLLDREALKVAERDALIAGALDDPDAGIRLRAGITRGDALWRIAEIARETNALASTRTEALEYLERHGSRALAGETALGCLDAAHASVRTLAAGMAGRFGVREAVPVLIARTREKTSDEEMAAVATALGAIGDPEAEPALLELLERHAAGNREVRIDVAHALERLGTAASVPPLRAIEGGALIAGDLERAATAAIARIQSRLEGAGAGQISIAEPAAEAGALTVADTEGALSIAHAGKKRIGSLE